MPAQRDLLISIGLTASRKDSRSAMPPFVAAAPSQAMAAMNLKDTADLRHPDCGILNVLQA